MTVKDNLDDHEKSRPELSQNVIPKTRNGHPRFYEIIEELINLHDRKNADYADDKDPLSNLKQSQKIGVPAHVGCFIRMMDKWDRLTGFFIKDYQVKEETFCDTLNDLAVYAILCRILYEETLKREKT